MPEAVPLVRLVRAGLTESIHRGSYVLCEDDHVLDAAGDTERPAYYRSTAKPFQALPLVTSGAADRFGLDDAELAIASGSHNATPAQLAVVRSLLAKADIDEALLGCGGHWSIDPAHARAQALAHDPPPDPLPAIWSNCSGTHAAMLVVARTLDAPLDTYLHPDHPVQRLINETIAAFAGLEPHALTIGLDGCSAPIAAVPLRAMARSLARLARPDSLDPPLAEGARRIGAAMTAHPELIGGEGRFDTDLMRAASVRLIAKAGAEGVHGVAVPDRGLGLAIQVDDGSDRGYRLVVIETLRRLGCLGDTQADALAERHGRTVRNHGGQPAAHLEVLI